MRNMNLTTFTVEEENFICVFDTSSRTALISDISAAIADFDESELREIARNTLRKLERISDAEFSELTFHPAYFGDDDELED